MRDDKRRSREEDVVPPKRKRSDDSPSHVSSSSKSRGHIPMSERQQFALLRQLETEVCPEKDRLYAMLAVRKDWAGTATGHPPLEDISGNSDVPCGGHASLAQTSRLIESDTFHSTVQHSHHHHHHHHRDRPTYSPTQHSPGVGAKFTLTTTSSRLFHVAKSGDIESLKQLVKQGIDLNERDERGRTVLHELSVHNHPRLVAYLLKHGAEPNATALNGDTALHEAVRGGCVRVIRSLLRHNADPFILNCRGERPGDVCLDAETRNTLLQHAELHRVQPKSSQSCSRTQPHHSQSQFTSVDRHLNSHGLRHTATTGIGIPIDSHCAGKSCSTTTTPDLHSDSDDTCSTSTTTPVSVTSMTTAPNEFASLPGVYGTSPSLPGQKNSVASESHVVFTKNVQKDPYAFEDEIDESTDGATPFHPSPVLTLTKSSSPNIIIGTNNQKARPSGVHTCVSGASVLSISVPNSECSPPPPLASVLSHSSDANISTPLVSGLIGPPLRLRFAKEAGQYTLMEHQQSSNVPTTGEVEHELTVPHEASHYDVIEPEVIRVSKVEADKEVSSTNPSVLVEMVAVVNNQSESIETIQPTVLGVAEALTEDSTSQKVPPLRIKFASGTSTDSEPGTPVVTTANSSLIGTGSSHSVVSDRGSHIDHSTQETSSETVPCCEVTDVSSVANSSSVISTVDVWIRDDEIPDTEACTVKSTRTSETDESIGLHIGSHASQAVTGSPLRSLPSSAPLSVDEIPGSLQSFPGLTSVDCGKEDSHRHRSGRTLRSHTAAQREREEKENHTDTTPIKKRKLRTRNENILDGNHSQQSDRSSGVPCTGRSVNLGTINSVALTNADYPDEDGLRTSDTVPDVDTAPIAGDVVPKTELPSHSTVPNLDMSHSDGSCSKFSDGDCDYISKMSDSPSEQTFKSPLPSCSTSLSKSHVRSLSSDGDDNDISYITCPIGPDDDKRDAQLFTFENPYEQAAALQIKLRELVNNLVEVHPKAPDDYQQYLLVSRNYLLAHETPLLMKRTPPSQLDQVFVELFNAQEDERYAQALKHQSEREHLRLCAEQARLRAQTRAALANQSKPLSFCSVMAYKDLTYVPPTTKAEPRDEENVRDRFTQRTFIGWLEDIRDSFQQEKKKMLCRQLHEAESLMMVQRLDWEMKLKECHIHDYRADIFRDIPTNHVPLIHVPNDFPLFPNDPTNAL